MPVHQLQPFRTDKNLGKAYNEAMTMIPDGDHACLRDIDTLLLSPNTPVLIEKYVQLFPDSLLTCFTNRVSTLSNRQLLTGQVDENDSIRYHINLAMKQENNFSTTPIIKNISGFLMVISKSLWKRFPFPETGQCLGIDTYYGRMLRMKGVQIIRMNAVYVFHTYRLINGIHDKKHLQ